MYKVFINDKPLALVKSENIGKFSTKNKKKYRDKNQLRELIHVFESDDTQTDLMVHHSNLDELWETLCGLYRVINAAGGIVKNGDKILAIFRNNIWDLPKGKLEGDEEISDGAIREVEEETGATNLTIEQFVATTWHTYKGKKNKILKRTDWFLITTDFSNELKPQLEEGITEVKWIKEDELNSYFSRSYKSLQSLLGIYSS